MSVFDRARAKSGTFGGFKDGSTSFIPSDPPVLTITGCPGDNPDDVILYMTNGRGKDILAVTADGVMHFAPGYTPTEQASAFRQAMNLLAMSSTRQVIFPIAPDPDLTVENKS